MKIQLDQLETRLQTLIEGNAARLFSFGRRQNDLGDRLVAAMRDNLNPQPDGSYWAPNLFTLEVHPTQERLLRENSELLRELARLLLQVGTEAGLQFPTPPRIKVVARDDLALQDILIMAQFNLEHLVDTSTLELASDPDHGSVIPSNAFFIVNGMEAFPLKGVVVNIGRSTGNHLVVDDPRVSRNHAQLRAIHGNYVLFDLDSMGGTFVNGQRITQSILYPGDVVSLAGLPLIYGEDSNRTEGETQEYDSL